MPRGIVLDSEGNLLLVDVGIGVVGYKIADRDDGSSCLIEKKVIVANKMVCALFPSFPEGGDTSTLGEMLISDSSSIIMELRSRRMERLCMLH